MRVFGQIDPDAPTHPKFIAAGPMAFGFFWAGVCYCNKHRTDGFIPAKALYSILPGLKQRQCVAEAVKLAEAGLWEVRTDGYVIHDFLKYNLSSADRREAEREQYERSLKGGLMRAGAATRIRGRFVGSSVETVTEPEAFSSENVEKKSENVKKISENFSETDTKSNAESAQDPEIIEHGTSPSPAARLVPGWSAPPAKGKGKGKGKRKIEAGEKQTIAVSDDGDYLASLRNNPAYQELNLDVELGKAQAWAQHNHRTVTRRFFVNWLNRSVERRAEVRGNGMLPGTLSPKTMASLPALQRFVERGDKGSDAC